MENWKPNYSGNKQYKKKNRYNQVDGDVVFRILPQPKGKNLERSGDWSRFHSMHFGYKTVEGKMRPFESPLVKKNKVVLVQDAALDRLNDLKAKLEQARAEGNGPLGAKLNTLVGLKGVYSLDSGHHMNVIGLDGNIGVFKIRYKAKLALDEEIKRLRSDGVDPISLEDGRFFVFSRSNTGKDTTFKVTTYQEKITGPNGRPAYQDVIHKVTPEILARLETEGFDLDNLAIKPTAEEVAQIVAESDLLSGKSPACNRFFDDRWKANRDAKNATQSDTSTSDDGPDDAPSTTSAPVDTGTSKASTLGALSAQTLAVAQPVLSTTLIETAVSKAQTQGEAVAEMSDADFFKMIDVKVTA